MICARAAPDEDFKACCMKSGAYDGANRNYYFQGVGSRSFWKYVPGLVPGIHVFN
jgi:hypothetical protein